jgi:cation transport protein ChaC
MAKAHGWPDDWRYSDAQIDAAHRAFLQSHGDQDLWVFGYASLMWDPGFRFVEVRRAKLYGYARRFCLFDILLRGSPDEPGLMAALSEGDGCHGLAFRIARTQLFEESAFFWWRELLGPVYKPMVVKLATTHGDISALTVVADPASEWIRTDLSQEQQVHMIATGKGFGGTSLHYIENIAAQFAAIGMEDEELNNLLAKVKAYTASLINR